MSKSKLGGIIVDFTPDYNNIINATKNLKPFRMPLYEHIICDEIMEKILNKKISSLHSGNASDKREYFKIYFL